MDANHHETCQRNEGYCLDSERCEACEAERAEELKREAAPDLYEALSELTNQVDARCGGRCEGNSQLAAAMTKAMEAIQKAGA